LSRMGKRRITFTLGVALDSHRGQLEKAIHRIEVMLKGSDKIDPATIFVKFNEFHASSLGIFFYFFTRSTVWGEYLSVRQEMNLEVMRILEEEKIKLAYPSQRIYVEEYESVAQREAG
jgi:MscS family membrane protein